MSSLLNQDMIIESLKNNSALTVNVITEIFKDKRPPLSSINDVLTLLQSTSSSIEDFKRDVRTWAIPEQSECDRLQNIQRSISIFFFWVRLILTCLMAITISIIWLALAKGSQDERLGICITTLVLGILTLLGLGYLAVKKGGSEMIRGGGYNTAGNLLIFVVATMSAVASFRLNFWAESGSDWAKVSSHFGSLSVVSMVLSLTSLGILKV